MLQRHTVCRTRSAPDTSAPDISAPGLARRLPLWMMVLTGLLGLSSGLMAETSPKCPGEEGYYFINDRKTNPRKGGFVGDGTYVHEDVFIAPSAAVCGSASIDRGARILGNALITGEAILEGYIRVMGNAIIGGTAVIGGEAGNPTIIKGYARIFEGKITSGRHGTNELPPDIIAAREAARKAAIRKDCEDLSAKKCYDLAYKYSIGKGVPRDDAHAASLFERACSDGFMKGFTKGCSKLGYMYRYGRGVEKDLERALSLYRQACESGSKSACSIADDILGDIYCKNIYNRAEREACYAH